MTKQSWVSATSRSIVWLGAVAWLAYLRKPTGGSILAVRGDAIGWLGIGLLVAGLALHVWSNLTLARAEAAPDGTRSSLAAVGAYRYVRNPIYVAGFVLLLGTDLLYPNWRSTDLVAAVVLLALFHLRVVRFEEPTLRRRFGAIYDEYCRRVPRWAPRLAPQARAAQRGVSQRSRN
jgi:protein-S-isoprenylcysteine O-methyltransferase Ste14